AAAEFTLGLSRVSGRTASGRLVALEQFSGSCIAGRARLLPSRLRMTARQEPRPPGANRYSDLKTALNRDRQTKTWRAGSVSDRSTLTPVADAPGSPLSPLPVPI